LGRVVNVEALTVIVGGAVLILLVVAPLTIWWIRRFDPHRENQAVLTRIGVVLVALHAIGMLASVIVAKFVNAVAGALLFIGAPLALWHISMLLHRRGFPIAGPRPNKSLERTREG
ncbi:MAG TPA: hypothetical protein VFS24_17620, partial [Steroidobacteraceae bacterium]|nr:hypothetical protein [Steroidobacteraceae bacterium]